MRDALADLLQGEAQYAAVVDHEGRIDGVLSVEIISEFLDSPQAKTEEHSAVERPAWLARRCRSPRPAKSAKASSTNAARDTLPCQAKPSQLFCLDWAQENIDRYGTPTLQHLELVVISVVLGFAIAFALALLAHRRRWLQPPLLAGTGVLYTIPSIAFFFLLLPITGRGRDTAIIALSAYTLQIIYRNTIVGLANVPESAKDAARGMGMTERQILWRVELPLAMPEIIAGLRIATVSTVAIATLAVFAGGGGLGDPDPRRRQLSFPTTSSSPAGSRSLMALIFDAILLDDPAPRDALATGERRRERLLARPARLDSAARSNSSSRRRPRTSPAARRVGGLDQVIELTLTQLEVTVLGPGAGAGRSRCRSASTSATGGPANCSRSASATPAGRSPSWR